MNLSKTIVSKKVLFTKKENKMRKAMTIITQVLIFTVAWFVMTPDQLIDNTHLFGLFGDVEITKGNTVWVLAGAAILSVLNIWFWWPKEAVANTIKVEGTSAEAKAEETKDPIVPKMD